MFKLRLKVILIASFILVSQAAQSASLEQSVKISIAGGTMCKIYAEEVGGNVEAFLDMNLMAMQFAEKMGYTKNLQSFNSEVGMFKTALQEPLLQEHGSKVNVYNDWCIRFYKGFQKGIAKTYQ